jgi:flagellar capping protein FliD
MSIKNISIIEIINKTKLDEITINEFIEKKSYNTSIKKSIKKNEIEDKNFSIEDEINEMKNDIKELKTTLKELVDMMKAVYEFEDL